MATSVFAVDVDGDGDIDVLSSSVYDDKIAWYENDGSQEFTPHTISTSARRAESVFAVDVDGDGDIDVLSASSRDDKIAWYKNDGSENFTAHTISTAADGARSVFAADVDGDGDIDVLSASAVDGKIAWYENLSPIAPRPPADLTGDGFVDFDDLTLLLAHWDQTVSAAFGNLVDPLTTPINFQDLTLLLAAWTGPVGAAQAPSVGGGSVGDFVGSGPSVAVGDASYRRRDRRATDLVMGETGNGTGDGGGRGGRGFRASLERRSKKAALAR